MTTLESILSFVGESAASSIVGKKLSDLYEKTTAKITGKPTHKQWQKQTLEQILTEVKKLKKQDYDFQAAFTTLTFFNNDFDNFYKKLESLDSEIAEKIANSLGIEQYQSLLVANILQTKQTPTQIQSNIRTLLTKKIDETPTHTRDYDFDLTDIHQATQLFSKDHIDHYTLLPGKKKEIGQTLLLPATNKHTKEQVYIKIPKTSNHVDQLQHEAKALTALRGLPGTTQLIGANFNTPIPYTVIPNYKGTPLRKLQQRTEQDKIKTTYQLLQTLRELHTRGLPHRSLTMDNILANDTIQIIDYSTIGRGKITNKPTGVTIDPDIRNEKHNGDHKSDIYSFGAILYQLHTGKPIDDRLTTAPKGIQTGNKNIDTIIRKCTQMNRHERYNTVDEIIETYEKKFEKHLQEYLDTPDTFEITPRKKPGTFILTVSLSLLLAYTAGFIYKGHTEPRPTQSQHTQLLEELTNIPQQIATTKNYLAQDPPSTEEFETVRADIQETQERIRNIRNNIEDNLNQTRNYRTNTQTELNRIQDLIESSTESIQSEQDRITERNRLNKIVFYSVVNDQSWQIYTINLDGSDRTQLTNPDPLYSNLFCSLTTDGRKIVFSSARPADENYNIYVMDSDGSNQRRLTNNDYADYRPFWSPNGQKVLFLRSEGGIDFPGDLYVMDSDGANEIKLLDDLDSTDYPSWSPDDQRLVFSSNLNGPNTDIYVMDSDGSNQRRLTFDNSINTNPSWSPDGSRIAFRSYMDWDGGSQIYIMDSDGSNQRRLTTNHSSGRLAWSPDGSMIAFDSNIDRDREIYVMDSDGSNEVRLTNSPGSDFHPSWSLDGRKIVFLSDRDGNREIYVMDSDGSNETRLTNNSSHDSFIRLGR